MSIFKGSSNADYHANNTHLSSSSLKLILKSASQFYNEFVLGNRENISKSAFDEGSFVHTLILEPHKVDEYAIFPGLRKVGKEFEAFKANNPNKVILSSAQMLRCEGLHRSYAAMPLALEMITGGLPEHSMDSSILDVPVKARADYINIDKSYIVDVKTTSMPSDTEIFKETVHQYGYELSAALYAQIAYNTYGKLFDFYWLVLSKADGQCHIYKASSNTLSLGSTLVTKALVKYKQCNQTGLWIDEHQPAKFDESQYEIVEV
jgi:hypothetical protein